MKKYIFLIAALAIFLPVAANAQSSCTASIYWDKQSVSPGGSATETWQIVGAERATGQCTGTGEIGISFGPQSYTFNNIQQDFTCTVKGYIGGVERCADSSTVFLETPTTKISVYAPSGLEWYISGPQSFSGSGSQTFTDVPDGQYSLTVTGGWKGRVVTSITPSPTQSVLRAGGPGGGDGETVPPGGDPPPGGGPPPTEPPPVYRPDPPQDPRDPYDKVIFKLNLFKFLSFFTKKTHAASNAISFTVNWRYAQEDKGTLKYFARGYEGSGDIFYKELIDVQGITDDYANAYTIITLDKVFRRLSDGLTETRHVRGWRGARADTLGNFSITGIGPLDCSTSDGVSNNFNYSDYGDRNSVVYDQGDDTGDRSPYLEVVKHCGAEMSLISVNREGTPIPITWRSSGPYSTWTNTDGRVSYTSNTGTYNWRLDRGINIVDVTPPPGYNEKEISFIIEPVRRRAVRSSLPEKANIARAESNPICINFPCSFNFAMPDEHIKMKIVWIKTTGVAPKCAPENPIVQIPDYAYFNASGGAGAPYWWSAPGGGPSVGDGIRFGTIFNTPGIKTVSVQSGGVTGTCAVEVVEGPPQTPPTVRIQAESPGITRANTISVKNGSPVALYWISDQADTCSAFGSTAGGWTGTKADNGNQSVGNLSSPPTSYSFGIRCSNQYGVAEDRATVNITSDPPPTVNLTIGAPGILQNDTINIPSGTAANLYWTTENVKSCSATANPANSNWSGSKAIVGTQSTGILNAPPSAHTFSIDCVGNNGVTVTDSVTANLSVSTPTLNVTLTPRETTGSSPLNVSFTATVSGSATGPINYYFWKACSSSKNTKDGVIADCGNPSASFPGISSQTQGTNFSYAGSVGAAFTPKVVVERSTATPAEDRASVSITGVTCTDPNGCGPNGDPKPAVDLKINGSDAPANVPYGGSATLTWTTGNGPSSCTASGDWSGAKSPAGGNQSTGALYNPPPGRTYTLTCTNGVGSTSDSVSAVVNGTISDACTFTAKPTVVRKGSSSVLEWKCDPSVTGCSISQGIGSVANSGTRMVNNLQQTTKYDLVCEGGKIKKSATVNVLGLDEELPN